MGLRSVEKLRAKKKWYGNRDGSVAYYDFVVMNARGKGCEVCKERPMFLRN